MLRRVDLDSSKMGARQSSTPQAPARDFRASTLPRMPKPSDPNELDRRFNKVLVSVVDVNTTMNTCFKKLKVQCHVNFFRGIDKSQQTKGLV